MANRSEIRFALVTAPLTAAAGALYLFVFVNHMAALAMVAGVALSAGSLALGRTAVKSAIRPEASKLSAVSRLELFLLLKLPVFALLAYWASSLGLLAAGCFLIGVVLVYLFLLVGAILSSFAPSRYDEVC